MTDSDLRQFAPATERNRAFILPILQRLLPGPARVLEIGSGSGEHGVFFCASMPWLQWQPTDCAAAALQSIDAWRRHAGLDNLAPALQLCVAEQPWPVTEADAVVAVNVLHYSPWPSTAALFDGAARILPAGGLIYCYGPYRRHGAHTAPSNAKFDHWLKSVDPSFGVRDLEAVAETAAAAGFQLSETIEMPANNFSLVFRRQPTGG